MASSRQRELQANFYARLIHDSPNFIPDAKIVLRPIKSILNEDSPTEIAHEPDITTDVAIGDITADIMITTTGKIPSGMYELDTTTNGITTTGITTTSGITTTTELHTVFTTTTLAPIKTVDSDRSEHSTLLCILIIALFVILFICCITACIIAKYRTKQAFLKQDIECSPECSGVNQPLLGLDKASDTTTKTSTSSTQN